LLTSLRLLPEGVAAAARVSAMLSPVRCPAPQAAVGSYKSKVISSL